MIFADVDCKENIFVGFFLGGGVGWGWHLSSNHTLSPNLVIFKFEIPEMLQEEVIVSGFIPPLL